MNPWNITEVANAIGQALEMKADEREKRHKHNFTHVTTHTAQEWAETFVRYVRISLLYALCHLIRRSTNSLDVGFTHFL